MFVIYDGRAIPPGASDDAAVLCCAGTLIEARRFARVAFGVVCAIYQYDEDHRHAPPHLINERFIEAAHPITGDGRREP